MTPEEHLAGLFGVAEDQQKAAQEILGDLVRERAKLTAAIEAIKDASSDLQTTTGSATSKAVTETLAKAPQAAVAALNAATVALETAAGKVLSAGAWITWQFALVFILTGAAAVATNYVIGRFTLPDRAEVEVHRAELEVLRSEKAELEANVAQLAKRGGRIKLSTCGPQNRLCVQITTKQGDAPMQTEFHGSWMSGDGKTDFVIPHGY
jgi:hypothetical protein